MCRAGVVLIFCSILIFYGEVGVVGALRRLASISCFLRPSFLGRMDGSTPQHHPYPPRSPIPLHFATPTASDGPRLAGRQPDWLLLSGAEPSDLRIHPYPHCPPGVSVRSGLSLDDLARSVYVCLYVYVWVTSVCVDVRDVHLCLREGDLHPNPTLKPSSQPWTVRPV